jgi:hypothetical protein
MLNFNAIASTNELSNVSSLRVYPNPTNDKLYIDSPVEAEQVQVTNLLGEVLLTVENSKQLSVAQLPAGVYMLNLIGDYGTLTKRFVKQ